ncbi:neprilysin-11 [Trichonephila inaurata madagascariensis]|uniref:Neprilysin-11 n=1 Tax=Trichonephila inaurata madagascariensis TaxID=2747483 RepID=A0A8X6XE12_9ARAC|nr:neprilysin-11 [Trichonephila inaurata madagascariensis]
MTASPLLLAACTALLFFTTFHIKQQGKEGERPKPVEHAICTTESCLKAGALESPTLYRTGGSLIKAKMLYETCMNSDTLEDDSVQVLRLFLSERGVGHWPVLDADWSSGDMNLEWRLAMLFVHHTPVFFHMYADAPSFYSEYILNVYPASSPLGAKEVSGADRERIFEAYHKLLIETLRLLGVPEVRVQADSFDIIGFELQFSMITNTSQQCLLQSNKDANETREDDTRLYNVTVDDLEYHIPQIKWSRLMSYVFRNLGLPLDTSSLYVMVHCKEYFRQLGTLLSNTPPRTLANYMSWKFVLSYMSFMSMPFRQIFQDYTLLTPELKHSKLKTYTSRWKGCVSLVGSWFGNAIAAYYARHGYPRDVEQKVINMKTEVGYPRNMLSADYVETFYAKLSQWEYYDHPYLIWKILSLQYDKEGRESRWWSEEMKNKFWMKAKCFVEQYNRYVIDAVEEKNVDGQRTLHENIADSTGLKKAFMSYQKYVKENGKEPKLPGMEFTNQQLFFISFAQMKCEVRNKEGFEEYIGDSSSSLLQTPFRYRVNGALANSEFFAAVFKCPSGSPMSHTKRCSIW